MFIAYPVWTDATKADRLSRLADEAVLSLGVDSFEGVQHIAAASQRGSRSIGVLVDATQLAIGSCGADDLALVAAATVVSVPEPGRFVLDAGSKVIAADTSPWVTGRGYLPAYPDATVSGLWEHHAVVDLPAGERGPALGSIVAVVPTMCARR